MGKLGNTAKDIKKETKSVKYPGNSAYQYLTAKVPVVDPKEKVSEARKLFFENIKDYETVNYFYAVNKNNKLKGVISVRDIFGKNPDTLIEKVMVKDLKVVHPKTKRERLATKALKANIKALPVVDDKNNFLGVVSSDSILSILYKEAQEDFLHLSGIIPSGEHFTGANDVTVTKSFIGRVPWVLIGLSGSLITATVVNNFTTVLSQNIMLAGFMPLVAYIANAVGTQTQTLYIRDLTTQGEIQMSKYTIKQVLVSTMIAIFSSAFIFVIGTYLMGAGEVISAVSVAVFIAISSATIFALSIPYLLSRNKLDPAIGSGPFTTTLQDLLSLLIYFIVASLLL